MNGPVFVNLPNSVSVHISNLVWPNEERSVRREYDDTDGSTVDIIPHSDTVRDNFGREVVRGPTHCLFKRGKLYMSALIRRPMRTNNRRETAP